MGEQQHILEQLYQQLSLQYLHFNGCVSLAVITRCHNPHLTQINRCYGVWHDRYESGGKSFKLQNTGNAVRNDTLWKAFNCITYNEDHLRGGADNIDSRLKNNFLTNGKDNIKTKAMETALELAAQNKFTRSTKL